MHSLENHVLHISAHVQRLWIVTSLRNHDLTHQGKTDIFLNLTTL